ncbi:hypothetical protein [Natronosalvus caseinilyticus]|uniref:hypothetical protein n=1 Tax=Natronosalvus caseinilyticus TaxID=2953747 RepID=UPI0028AE4CD2|nr:hypothetical protein [Natronosalvus caseinilyticus]
MRNSSFLSGIRPLRLDTVAAIIGLFLALAMLPLRLLASQIYIKTVPIVLGLACGLYLLSLYAQNDNPAMPTLSRPALMALPTLVLFGLSALVALSFVQGERTLAFFVLSGVVGTLLIAQIVFSEDETFNTGLVLLQLVLFAFVFRFTALYATPGYIGIDIWTHMDLAGAILEERSLSAISHDKHYGSPLYHLLVASSALVFDVPLRAALYLTVGVVMPLSILLVYATANLLISPRWSALAAGLFAMASYVSMWGMHLIPTSMGLVFFLGVLYALIRVMRIEYTIRDFTLLLVLSLAVILTHQVSTFIMLVVLVTAFLAQLVFMIGPFGLDRLDTNTFRTKKPVNLIGLVVFNFGLTIFVWSLTPYRQDSFLGTVLSYFTQTIEESAGFLNIASGAGSEDSASEVAAPTLLDQVVPYVDSLGFLLLLGLTFAGCLYVVHRKRAEQSVFTLLLASAFMLVFVMGLPMFGIRNFIPTRWFAFLYAPMAILGAIAIRVFIRDLDPRLAVVTVLLVVLVYPGAMAFAAETNTENPIFDQQHEQLAYDESELTAVSSIGEMTGSPSGSEIRPDQQLHTDHPYFTVFGRTGAYPSSSYVTIPEDGVAEHDYTVYRTSQTESVVYFVEDERAQLKSVDRAQICRPTQATVYDNGDVNFCTPSPVSN